MKQPVLEILNDASGTPVSSFVTDNPNDVFTAKAWFTKDSPEGTVVHEWIVDPPEGVEFLPVSAPDWKKSFKAKGFAKMFVRAFDENGFHHDSNVVTVRLI